MSSDRLHALDATRAFALLLGIVLHATMSFFLFFPAKDVSPSTTLAVSFYVIHMFRMSLFYVIAGFFAHMVFHRRGARAFLKDRGKRIAVPMVVGWLILAPATIAAVIWGMSRSYPELAAQGGGLPPGGFPLTHLWFLYYLCIFYLLVLGLRAAFVRLLDRSGKLRARVDAIFSHAVRRYLAPLVLALPIIAVLVLDAKWAVWFGIPTPDKGLLPQIPALVAYGSAFAFGWLLHRQVPLLQSLQQQWLANLALAAILTLGSLLLVGPTPMLATPTAIEGGAVMRVLYAASYVLATWFWSLGLIGAATRFFSGHSGMRRYLADASYWMYLVHVPIVFVLQTLVADLPFHWAIKFPLVLAVSFAVLLVSYHYLVRSTFLGEVLNGRKYPRGAVARESVIATPDQPCPAPVRIETESVARLADVSKCYGATLALEGIDLSVRPGELLAVLGPNGAGKSTAIELWLGTLLPDRGSVRVLGGSPLEVQSRLGVGVMMQDVALAPQLSPREHIELASSYYRNPLAIDEVIAKVGIKTFADKRYGKLSAGQKRQVQFAVAICGRPRLLFLDEPTVGLDIEARKAMWDNIRRLLGEGCSIILTTHYLEEAEALADRVAVLARGHLVAEGSVDEMRALVARKRISCVCKLELGVVRQIPGVVEATRENGRLEITAIDAEPVVWQLMTADPALSKLEVSQAGLAEAFTELTKEAA